MDCKFCPECGTKLFKSFKFCPECGLNLSTAHEIGEHDYKQPSITDEQMNAVLEARKAQAMEDFRKSVLAVAEAFFAMSEEERKDMVEYTRERAREAEEEYNAKNSK